MTVLGVRCSNKNYSFAVLKGNKDSPELADTGGGPFPPSFTAPYSLKWFYQEIDALLAKHDVEKIVVKSFEGRFRDKNFERRVEHEAVIWLAGANRGLKALFKKTYSTIAKDLGFKGRKHYLKDLDTSPLLEFESYSQELQDAIYAAWSELP